MGFNWGRLGAGLATGGLSELGGIRPLAEKLAPDTWNQIAGDPGADAERQRKAQLYGQAGAAGGFADQQQQAFAANQLQGVNNISALQRTASGQNSVSAEQLRQALQQNLAAQRSMAAGASPQNAAMAARTAAIQSGRLGAGLAGQQALAGLQERNQAQQALTGAIQGYGQQALGAAQGARGQAIQAYGAGEAGAPEKSWLEKYGPTIESGAAMVAKSDRRAKRDIRDGDEDANKAMDGIKAYMFAYKDKRDGKGRDKTGTQLGVMAQDMERAGLGHAVIDTPGGKMVHGAKAATSAIALTAALARRVKALEAGAGRKAA